MARVCVWSERILRSIEAGRRLKGFVHRYYTSVDTKWFCAKHNLSENVSISIFEAIR